MSFVAPAENERSRGATPTRSGKLSGSTPAMKWTRTSPRNGSLVDEGLGRDGEAADEGRGVVGDAGECVVEGEMSGGL